MTFVLGFGPIELTIAVAEAALAICTDVCPYSIRAACRLGRSALAFVRWVGLP